MLFRFGDYVLDTQRYELLQAGKPVALRPKALDLLICLIEHENQVVSKQNLLERLWPGRAEVVSDAMLNSLVMDVRQAVGDSGTEQRIIQTKRGRGYCFIATVEAIPENFASASAESTKQAELMDSSQVENTEPMQVSSLQLKGDKSKKRRGLRLHITAVLAVLLIASVSGYLYVRVVGSEMTVASEANMAYPLPDRPSMVVLPFENLSGDPAQDYFVDSITENIITTLAKIPNLFVIARNSTFVYKNKPVSVKQVAEELGVRYVLEGSVQKSKQRVRINAQLVDALTGHHRWAENYDREIKDIFELQDDITWNLATELEVQLTEGEQARVWRRETDNPEAYFAYAKGVEAGRFDRSDRGWIRSQQLLKKAVSLDPDFASAWAYLGHAYRGEAWFAETAEKRDTAYQKAIEVAHKALSIDENNAAAYALLGGVYMNLGHHNKAIKAAEKSVELLPNGASNLAMLGIRLTSAGRAQEGIVLIKRAMRLNPYYPPWQLWVLGLAHYYLGKYDLAIDAYEDYFERFDEDDPEAYAQLAAVYVAADRLADAQKTIVRLRGQYPTYTLSSIDMASYKDPAEKQRFRAAVLRAGLPE